MKRILFLTPYVPSNRAGGENFTRLLLEHLSQNNQIDLVYYRYIDDPEYVCPNKNVRVIKEVLNSVTVKLKNCLMHPFVHPIFTIRFNRNLLCFLQKVVNLNRYDFLYLDHTQMAFYGKYFPELQKIYMSHDVMAQRFSRQGTALNRTLILSGERNLMSLPNTTVFTFSEKDRAIIKDIYGLESKVTNFFLDQMIIDAIPIHIEKNIVFFGKWKRADNFDGIKWFFENVYNHLNKNIKITIIGKWLPKNFEKQVITYSNVEYLGFVDNPYPLISNAMATISPLFSGAGVKVKVVESLACGTPVIGSNIAFEGIADIFREFMFHAETVDEYIKVINGLSISLEERQKYKKMFMTEYHKQSICSYIENN